MAFKCKYCGKDSKDFSSFLEFMDHEDAEALHEKTLQEVEEKIRKDEEMDRRIQEEHPWGVMLWEESVENVELSLKPLLHPVVGRQK